MKGGALQTPPRLFCILSQRSVEVMLQTEVTAVWARKVEGIDQQHPSGAEQTSGSNISTDVLQCGV